MQAGLVVHLTLSLSSCSDVQLLGIKNRWCLPLLWFDAILHWFEVAALNCARSLELLITILGLKLRLSCASQSAIHERKCKCTDSTACFIPGEISQTVISVSVMWSYVTVCDHEDNV